MNKLDFSEQTEDLRLDKIDNSLEDLPLNYKKQVISISYKVSFCLCLITILIYHFLFR